jgi:hypothetical protein
VKRVASAQRAPVFSTCWMAVTTALYILSGLIFHFPGSLPPNNGDAFNPSGVVGALVNGGATGVLIGVAQMLLLRMIGRATWRWAAGTAIALLLIHIIGDVLPDGVALPLMTLAGGVILGGAQWWALRWPRRQGLLWLVGTAAPWSVGIQLGNQLAAGADWRTEHLIIGVWTGVLLGAATGVMWLWRLSSGTPSADGPFGPPVSDVEPGRPE